MNQEWYMTLPAEVAKHNRLARAKGQPEQPRGSIALFEAMAQGNKELFGALWTFWNFEHALDDLLDESPLPVAGKESVLAALADSVTEALRERHLSELTEMVRKFPLDDFQQVWEKLVDHSGWSEERKLRANQAKLLFFVELISNPFIRRHAGELRSLLISAIFRCLDGDAMAASSDPVRRGLAPAVRCGDVDVIIYLIYLARGFGAARVWGELREYDEPD